jgi:hypothetical protein
MASASNTKANPVTRKVNPDSPVWIPHAINGLIILLISANYLMNYKK